MDLNKINEAEKLTEKIIETAISESEKLFKKLIEDKKMFKHQARNINRQTVELDKLIIIVKRVIIGIKDEESKAELIDINKTAKNIVIKNLTDRFEYANGASFFYQWNLIYVASNELIRIFFENENTDSIKVAETPKTHLQTVKEISNNKVKLCYLKISGLLTKYESKFNIDLISQNEFVIKLKKELGLKISNKVIENYLREINSNEQNRTIIDNSHFEKAKKLLPIYKD